MHTSTTTSKEGPRRFSRRFRASAPLFSLHGRLSESCSTRRRSSGVPGGCAPFFSSTSGAPSTCALDVDSLASPRRSSLSLQNSTVGCFLSSFRHAPLFSLLPILRADSFISSSAPSLDCAMEHNPRLPSVPAGENSAGQTRGFNLKIATQYPSSSGAPPSTDQPPVSAAQSVLTGGPSAPQLSGQATAATTTHSQPVVSIANSSTGAQLISGDPAASGRHAFGALPRTPVPQREQFEEPGINERPGGSERDSTVDRSARLSPRLCSSFPRDQQPRAEDLTATPPPRGFGSGHLSLDAFPSERFSRAQSPAPVPDRAQQRLDALHREEQQLNKFLESRRNEIRAAHGEMQSLEAALADRRKSLDDAEVHAQSRRAAHQQEQDHLQAQSDAYR